MILFFFGSSKKELQLNGIQLAGKAGLNSKIKNENEK